MPCDCAYVIFDKDLPMRTWHTDSFHLFCASIRSRFCVFYAALCAVARRNRRVNDGTGL